jgi:2-C-methyl-D-erythritol 2,4-cyclodiphosphate synthase
LLRIGFGYDAHRLIEGLPLILGGVEIPHDAGLEGHSDADVLTHAVIDAVIGALALGDIGQHFPDSDPAYKGAASISLLRQVMAWVSRDGFQLNNLDATIVAQRPRLMPFLTDMREKLAEALEADIKQVNVKATTTEKMGFCGQEEGIAAYAVASIISV